MNNIFFGHLQKGKIYKCIERMNLFLNNQEISDLKGRKRQIFNHNRSSASLQMMNKYVNYNSINPVCEIECKTKNAIQRQRFICIYYIVFLQPSLYVIFTVVVIPIFQPVYPVANSISNRSNSTWQCYHNRPFFEILRRRIE